MNRNTLLQILKIAILLLVIAAFASCSTTRRTKRSVRKNCDCPRWTLTIQSAQSENYG